jgi:hypothetical protein
MTETPRKDDETGGTAQPQEPLRSTDEESEEGLAAQNENEDEEIDLEDEEDEADEDEDTRQ